MNKQLINRILIGVCVILGAGLIIHHGLMVMRGTKHAESMPADHNMNQQTQTPSETPIIPPKETVTPPPAPKVTPPQAVAPAPVPNPVAAPPSKNFIVQIDDYTADPASITVNKGTNVTLVVRAKTSNVYYGGIELRSPVVSTGTISAGNSATVTFTADETFTFTPYWPASGVKKDYTFKVNVTKPL